MTTPETGPDTPPEPRQESGQPTGEAQTFGERACARSEVLLDKHGASEQEHDSGEARLVYRWRAGWHWRKLFTLSRPDFAATPETVYSLEYKDLDTGGDSGRFDYTRRQGILPTSEIALKYLKESLAEQHGQDPATIHEEDLLDYLSSEAKKDMGF